MRTLTFSLILFITIFTFHSCNESLVISDSNSLTTQSRTNNLSSQDVVKFIFLGYGPLTEKLNLINSNFNSSIALNSPELDLKFLKLKNIIDCKNPNFFNELEIALKTEDPEKLSELLGYVSIWSFENMLLIAPEYYTMLEEIGEGLENSQFINPDSTINLNLLSDAYRTKNAELLNGLELVESENAFWCTAVAVTCYAAAAVHNTVAVTANAAVAASLAVAVAVKVYYAKDYVGPKITSWEWKKWFNGQNVAGSGGTMDPKDTKYKEIKERNINNSIYEYQLLISDIISAYNTN